MLKISVLHLNSPKSGIFSPYFCTCKRKFSHKKNFFDRLQFQGVGDALSHARTPLDFT